MPEEVKAVLIFLGSRISTTNATQAITLFFNFNGFYIGIAIFALLKAYEDLKELSQVNPLIEKIDKLISALRDEVHQICNL